MLGGGTARPQQVSLQCHFSPLMWTDFSSPSSSTSTRSRPFSMILQRQTDRRMAKGQAARVLQQQAAGSEACQ